MDIKEITGAVKDIVETLSILYILQKTYKEDKKDRKGE